MSLKLESDNRPENSLYPGEKNKVYTFPPKIDICKTYL